MWERIRSVARRSLAAVRRVSRSAAIRTTAHGLAVLVVAVVGVVLGILVAGRTHQDVGPFRAEFAVTPSLVGDTAVRIPPLGSLTLDSHEGPVRVSVEFSELDRERTEQLIADPNGVAKASDTAFVDVQRGMVRLILQASGAGLLGALLLGALVFRRDTRRIALTGAVALGLIVVSIGLTVGTFRPNSIEEPRYEGLLVNAPVVLGDARRIANRYDEYRAELQRLVRNVSRIYTTVSRLPVIEPDSDTRRVLHVSDLHLNPAAFDVIATVVEQFNIEVVVDTGDLTDWGTEHEADLYAAGIGRIPVPYVFIRGNHDSAITTAAVARHRNATVLDGNVATVAGFRFAGIGDPRFTPDHNVEPDLPKDPRDEERIAAALRANSRRLADVIRAQATPVDMALIHDPIGAGPLAGVVPLVLAGHRHKREVRDIGDGTLLMVEGSTGGAGIRGLKVDQPPPLELSVLYFSREKVLRAYDDIRVGGTGRAEVTLERRIVPSSNPSPTPTNNR